MNNRSFSHANHTHIACVHFVELISQDWTTRVDVRLAFTTLYTLIFVCGLVGNTVMILTIVRMRKLTNVASVFLLNLGICDMCLCMTALPLAPVTYFTYTWRLGGALCRLAPYLQCSCVVVSQFSLCAIAIDRYQHIVGNQHGGQMSFPAMLLTLFVTWTFGFALNTPQFLVHVQRDLPGLCGVFCIQEWGSNNGYKKSFGIFMIFFDFIVPLIIQGFCFSRIFCKVGRDMIDTPHDDTVKSRQNVRAARTKNRVMYTLVAMVIVFALSWLPVTIYQLAVDLTEQYDMRRSVVLTFVFVQQPFFCGLLVHTIAFSSIIWHPILYFYMSKAHRKTLIMFTRRLCDRPSRGTGVEQRVSAGVSATLDVNRRLLSLTSPTLYASPRPNGRAAQLRRRDKRHQRSLDDDTPCDAPGGLRVMRPNQSCATLLSTDGAGMVANQRRAVGASVHWCRSEAPQAVEMQLCRLAVGNAGGRVTLQKKMQYMDDNAPNGVVEHN